MQAKSSSILEVREYNGLTVLCQLRVMPRPVAATEKQSLSYRWLQNKHWARLDDELERILDSVSDQRRILESERAFSIGAQIRVRLRRSCVPVKVLLRCVNDKQLDRRNIALALECFIEHNEGKEWSRDCTNESVKAVFGCNETESEYYPKQVCSQADSDISSYVPYTPAKKNESSSSAELMNSLECVTEQEDRYSPIPVLELTPTMPPQPYTPSPIRRNLRSSTKLENIFNASSETEIDIKSEEKCLPDRAEVQKEWPKRSSRRRAGVGGLSTATHKTEESKVELNVLYSEVSQSFSPLRRNATEAASDGSQEIERDFTTYKQQKPPRKAAISSTAVVNTSKKLKYNCGSSPEAFDKSNELILTPQQDEAIAETPPSGETYIRQKTKHVSRLKKHNNQRHKSNAERTELKLNKKLISNPNALDAEQSSGTDSPTKQRHAQGSSSKLSPADDGTVKEPRSLTAPGEKLRRTAKGPKRLIDELLSSSKRPHKKVHSPSKLRKLTHKPSGMKDMFGSDTDGDDFATQTPAPKTAHRKLSSSKKRKHASDCAQEKQSIGVWLGKRKEVDASKAKKAKSPTKASSSKLALTATVLSEMDVASKFLSKEEMAERMEKEKLQIEKNKKLQEMLQDLMESTKPQKVDILSLDDMSSNEILASFNQYKPTLDDTFQKLYKRPNVGGHNGVNHYAVMDLINSNKQLDMMHKLTEVYEQDHGGISLYAKLFANVMMPEWVLGIFMEKFKLTHAQAIKQLKAQRDYKFYLEYQAK